MNFKLENIVRKNIRELTPYSSARNEFSGKASVFLDANENPYNFPYNRYPDPVQKKLKAKVSELYKLPTSNIFLGNGSDEAIDLTFRIFCDPGRDNVVSITPSYGMYEVCASVNDIGVKKVLLNKDYSFSSEAINLASDNYTKLIFLCSPNNPSGNLLEESEIIKLLDTFKGIVVVDEAYIDFSGSRGMLPHLDKYPNLIILRTFSKAWGLAGIRLGMAFASKEIIELFTKVKYPYNLNILTQEFALENLKDEKQKESWVEKIIRERGILESKLSGLNTVEKVFPSDANFLLVKMSHAREMYDYLKEKEIIVRDRTGVVLCNDSLRITIGTEAENALLMKEMEKFSGSV
ncbi:MAG: histidinol-phosphate transaminase [Bacteroidota bacterium]